MSFERLTCQINDLSEQIEALIVEGNEEPCPALLAQRLALLEELALFVQENTLPSQNYHDFLLSIQARDVEAIELVNVAKSKIISQSSHQKKRNNALNTYHKFSE